MTIRRIQGVEQRLRERGASALSAAALAFMGAMNGGCVFREIRDEVRMSNVQIGQVESQLATTKDAIDQTNAKLAKVDEGLARLDATNLSLSDVRERLVLLRSIDVSLAKVDVHLASLRKTIGQIDSMIPFVDLGGDVEEAPAESAAVEHFEAKAQEAAKEEAAAAEAPAPAAEATGAGAQNDAAPVKRDALIGAWVSEYPERSTALVVLEDGRYVRQTSDQAGKWTTESGTWKREGMRLHFKPDRPAAPPPAAREAKPGAVPAAPPGMPEYSLEFVNRTVKSMTLRGDDGRIFVFAKP